MKTEEENMLYIKKYSGFIISIVIGLLLYEEANYAYTYRAATAYSDHMIYRLILSMGSGSSGWNGILFPILAALPMGISYVREYRSGYLKLRLQKMSRKTSRRKATTAVLRYSHGIWTTGRPAI